MAEAQAEPVLRYHKRDPARDHERYSAIDSKLYKKAQKRSEWVLHFLPYFLMILKRVGRRVAWHSNFLFKSLITKSFVKMKFFKFYLLSVCIRILFVEVKRKFITQNWNWRNTSHNSQIRVQKAFEKLSYICTRFSQQRKKKLDKRWKKVT